MLRGHDIEIITASLEGEPQSSVVDGIRVTRLQIQGNYVRGISGSIDQYRRRISESKADLIVYHCAQTWTVDALLDYKLGRKRNVLISHGLSEYKNSNYTYYFKKLAEFLGENRFEVVALSEKLEEPIFLERYGLKPASIIPNGVKLEEWSTDGIRLKTKIAKRDGPWVITVGNHDPAKDHGLFFRVVRHLRNDFPGLEASIFGRPHVCSRRFLSSLRVKGGCWYKCLIEAKMSGVSLETCASRAEVVDAIMGADLVLITSSREAYPIVALESMAAGTPWISRPIGAVEEIPGGVIVTSEEEMVARSAEILRYRSVGSSVAELPVPSKFGWAEISTRYEQLMLTILGQESRR